MVLAGVGECFFTTETQRAQEAEKKESSVSSVPLW